MGAKYTDLLIFCFHLHLGARGVGYVPAKPAIAITQQLYVKIGETWVECWEAHAKETERDRPVAGCGRYTCAIYVDMWGEGGQEFGNRGANMRGEPSE